MLEWGLVILIGGLFVIIERQVTIGRNQMTILGEMRLLRGDLRAFRQEVDAKANRNTLLLGDALEQHLDVPEERRIFGPVDGE